MLPTPGLPPPVRGSSISCKNPRVYPRPCGEAWVSVTSGVAAFCARSIPARAGKPLVRSEPITVSCARVYPRPCGEAVHDLGLVHYHDSSTVYPRPCGEARCITGTGQSAIRAGSIPARAGKPVVGHGLRCRSVITVYPRPCGEAQPPGRSRDLAPRGSIPARAGKPLLHERPPPCNIQAKRSIPARAGKPRCRNNTGLYTRHA